MKAFIAWVAGLVALLGAAYFGFELSAFDFMWFADISKMSFICLGVFSYGYLRLGRLLFRRYQGQEINDNDLDPGFEAADTIMALGMLGTVIGFIAMASSFTSIDFAGVESVKQLFAVATKGMSTAMYTTAAGLACAIPLRTLYYITQRTVKHDSSEV